MHQRKQYLILLCILSAQFFIFISCARMETPTGGPKDLTPPLVLESVPANKSTQVNPKNITLTFDEYVSINNATEQIIISPVPSKTPTYTIKGKSLVIKFDDTLSSNKTYTINTGEAIKDINENNVLSNYTYTFSTSSILDTCIIRGKVIDAFTLKPLASIFIFVYENFNDSLLTKGKPDYIAKTNTKGEFVVSGLKQQSYTLLALKDINKNLKFDALFEQIGFTNDTLFAEPFISDTDTTTEQRNKQNNFSLFQEKDTIQKLITAKYLKEGCVIITLNIPTSSITYYPFTTLQSNAFIEERNPTNDTLRLWIKDFDGDSLKASIMANGILLDTINIGIPKKIEKKQNKKQQQEETPFSLNIYNNAALFYYKSILYSAVKPMANVAIDSIRLYETIDTITKTIRPTITLSENLKHISINYKWNSIAKYRLFIPSNTCVDVIGNENDSVNIKFIIKPIESFGIILLHLKEKDPSSNYIVQLLNEKETQLYEKQIINSNTIKIENILPGNYKIRLITDTNKNGKWDTGKFSSRTQPEYVEMYKDKVLVKENWDTEIEW